MALGEGLNTATEDPGQDRVWGLGKAPKGVLFFVLVKVRLTGWESGELEQGVSDWTWLEKEKRLKDSLQRPFSPTLALVLSPDSF